MADVDQMQTEMDANNLYNEEIVTDRKIGTIRVLTPITVTGARDTGRAMIFTGEVQIMTQMGPIPIAFEIPGATVAEAVANYGQAAKDGVKKTFERMEQMRREAANKIVTPGDKGFSMPPSGGRIQMP